MSTFRVSTRFRHVAASTGALAVAGVLALSGVVGGGAEMTEAAWSDKEVAQASVRAEFPPPADSWVRATSNAFSNYGNYTPTRTPSTYILPRTVDRPISSPASRQVIATQGDDYSISNNFGIRTLGTRPDTSLQFCSQANKGPSPLLSATYSGCSGGSNFTDNYSMARTQGFGTAGGFAHPENTRVFGGTDDILAVEAQNIRTMTECSPTGESRALAPSATASWGGNAAALGDPAEPYGRGLGIGLLFANVLGVGNPGNGHYSYLGVPPPNKRITRWMQPLRIRSAGDYELGLVFFRATITSRQYATLGYALSDIYVTIDQYTTDDHHPYTGSFTMILSRSECGLQGPTYTHRKLASVFEPRWRSPATSVPAYAPATPVATVDAPLPRQDGTLSHPGDSDYLAISAANYHAASGSNGLVEGGAGDGVLACGMRADEAAAADFPPTTTLTSPLENSTASETTTSAPPNPSEEDEAPTGGTTTAATTSTTRRTTTVTSQAPTVTASPTSTTTPPATKTLTSTSAAPAVSIPEEPGTFSPTARLEDVGTVTVGGEDFVVVVQGTTVPTDAQQGVVALEIWLNGGDPGDTWATFTSTDPDADGWRWAAINQETGTVVYIR